jgi:hypothetical protein
MIKKKHLSTYVIRLGGLAHVRAIIALLRAITAPKNY